MKEIVIKVAVFLGLFCVVTPLLLLWQGWSISTLWNWFVAPLGLPQIGVVTATGFALVAGALRMRKSSKDQTNAERYEAIAALVIIPPAAVAMGWIIKTFA